MKKVICLLLVFLCGCQSGYTLNRNHESEKLKLMIMSDINHTELDNFSYENVDVQKIYCAGNCTSLFKEIENGYFDGIILNGDLSVKSYHNYNNVNEMPVIIIQNESELNALKRLYSQYKWENSQSLSDEKDSAIYYKENEKVDEEKVFYQKDNPKSICQLVENREQFLIDLNKKINELLDNKMKDSIVTMKLKKETYE